MLIPNKLFKYSFLLAKKFFTVFIVNMKITNIQPQLTTNYNINRHQTNPQQTQTLPQYKGKLPSTQQYLAFTGGYSLNLAQTVKQLDKLSEKDSIYPPNIREWVGLVLEEGNRANETLIGIHKKYFSSLKECLTLNEIKSKFSEFKDVLPAMNVDAKEGSFIDKFQKGELEFFDNDEDLSIQLIKLYWGEGFSLNDLKRYAGGVNLYNTMKKLGIPTASRDYGHYLKFSDPQYNERLTREMTEKRMQALDRRAQIREGEPVHIPRGPLSEQHKRRISEGLNRFHEEHPEAVYQMSERRKEFYRQNPECAEELSRVLKKAWGLKNSENIKKAMSKFFKGRKVAMFDLENPAKITREQSKTMEDFWGANSWAKKAFSKAMKYGWKKVKEENEMVFTLRTSPTQIVEFIEDRAEMSRGSLDVVSKFNPFLKTSSIDETSNEILKKYTDIEGLQNVMADTYQISIFNMLEHLEKLPKHKQTRNENDFEILLKGIIYYNTDGKRGYKTQTTEEAQRDFVMIAQLAAKSKDEGLIDIVNKSLDEAFDVACQFHQFILK